MKPTPLEDNFTDVVGKAQRGLKINDSTLASLAGISGESLQSLKSGEVDAGSLAQIAPHLRLDGTALVAMARGEWYPEVPAFADGFRVFTTQYGDMTVNSYLAWDLATREAVAFDSGATCEGMLAFARENGLSIRLILVTHTHEDHIEDLPRLKSTTGAPVYLSARGTLEGATPFPEGHVFKLGSLSISTLETYGHAEDGATFVIEGLSQPLAIVGDSLFASSMGGSMTNYEDAFRNNVEKIFKLPDDTVLASGHGPLTTVGQEKRHNPFFASHFA